MTQIIKTDRATARAESETRIVRGRIPDTWYALGLRRKLYVWFPNSRDAKPLSRLTQQRGFFA